MAATQLSDVIIPAVFLSYDTVDSPERIAYLQSGVVETNELLNEAANRGGQITTIPFWNDLDATVEPNISTDNPADIAVPQKVGANEMTVRIADYNESWSTARLAGLLAGSSPMQRIRERTDMYWARQWQHKLIAVGEGVRMANIANNGGDMVYDISVTGDGGNWTPDASSAGVNYFSRDAFTEAAFTLGDRFDDVVAIAMHSRVFRSLTKAQLIDFVQPANVPLPVPMYDNKYVIVDDGLPMIADGHGNYKYVTTLYGRGVFGFGEGLAPVPVETISRPEQGNGAGVDTLFIRKRWIMQPTGHSFTSASLVGLSPTNAEIATGANWVRKVPRKNVPLAFLVTNG
jgi:hypothetical protein